MATDDDGRMSVPSGHQPLMRRSGSVDNGFSSGANAAVLNYVNSHPNPNGQPNLIRSNSYSLQNLDRQRNKSLNGSMDENICNDDPMFGYFQHLNKGRRVSKSLPELRALKHFPLVATQYTIDESDDEEDDDSMVMQDIPVATAWSGKSDFIFTGIGLALGLNNIWRFPYFCFKFGGTFFVVYMILMLACGLPLLAMEYAMGQLTRRGPIAAFGSLCPLLKGVPVAAAFSAMLLAPLYSTINAWSLSYFFKSFYSMPLWAKCSNPWNSDNCIHNATLVQGLLSKLLNTSIPSDSHDQSPYIDTKNDDDDDWANSTVIVELEDPTNATVSDISANHLNETIMCYATQQFFDNKLLELNMEESSWGGLQWELIVFILITWFAVFVSLRKNILFSSHPTYCLAIVPFFIMGILFTRSLLFDGARIGILHFLRPSWEGIREPRVWLYAAAMCFHSLGSVIGISFAKATCNKERNNFLRDAFIICLINAATVLLIGCTIFATLGSLSARRHIELPNAVVDDPGLAFIVFSELLSTIPLPAICSVAFFLILFCVGCDYQISVVAAFLVAIEDAYGLLIKKTFFSHQFFIFVVCIISSAISLLFVTQKGILMISLVDQYVTVLLTLILAFFEVILIGWFYGGNNLAQVIKLKVSVSMSYFFSFSWNFITPFTILGILGYNGYYFSEPLFRRIYQYPIVMQLIVHITVILLLLLIPVIAYRQVKKIPNTTILVRILNACKPKEEQTSSQIFETGLTGPGSRKPSSILAGLQVSNNPRNSFTMIPTSDKNSSYRGSTLKVPITLSLVQGLDRETEI